MKKAFLFPALYIFAVYGIAADVPETDQKQIESLIAAIPTAREFQMWTSMPAKVKKSPPDKELAAKVKAAPGNCKKLESLLTVGKPVSDYPGLLAIGIIKWDEKERLYALWVLIPGMEEFGYSGFMCKFDSTMVITEKHTEIHTL